MSPQTALQRLKELHREIEADAGKDPAKVGDDTVPLDELGGFDSLLIPSVIRRLAGAMGVPLAKGKRLRNCYVDPKGNRLPLRRVAERFCQLYR